MKQQHLFKTQISGLKVFGLTFILIWLFGFQGWSADYTWVGGHPQKTTDWHTKQNWNPQIVPTSADNVIITNTTNQPIISSTASCSNLTISSGSSLTITGNLTVGGALTNSGSIVINSTSTTSGSFINNGSLSGTGTVTYNRWMNNTNMKTSNPITPGYSRWYITSAPVNVTSGFGGNATKIHQDANASNVYDFATYSESANDWTYLPTIPAPLASGVGYLISLKPESDGMIQFTGALNDGVGPISITRTGDYKGWNGLGNPYTSAIRVAVESGLGSFLGSNSGQLDPDFAAIYVWNETAAYGENSQYYRIIGNAGYTYPLTDISLLGGVVNIQAGQGFLVKSKVGGGSIGFTKAMQRHESGLSLKSAEVSWPGITLLAESDGQTRSTVVAYNEQMTTGLDVTYDAGLLSSSYFNVYTHLVGGDNTVDFAIQCLPDNQFRELSVPVGVDLPEGGELSFKASGVILPQGLYPVIEDKLLNTKMALKTETDSYTVSLDKNTSGTGRFYLSVAGIGVGTTEIPVERKFTASFINNRMVVWGAVEAGTKAILYDITGRKVGEYPLEKLNRNEIRISGLSQRLYLLKIEGKNYSQVIKVVGE